MNMSEGVVMGARNYLIEGVSGTGKSSVCRELRRRGHSVVDGDRELAYQGDPETGEETSERGHAYHIWDVSRVNTLVADDAVDVTFFCGGSRNFHHFIHLFDGVFVLDVDAQTLNERLDERSDPWGKTPEQRSLILRLRETGEDLPTDAVTIDATRPLGQVVDEILARVQPSELEA